MHTGRPASTGIRMSYVRCLRGLASGFEYPADVPMNLDPVDGRPVEMVLDLERLSVEQRRRELQRTRDGRAEGSSVRGARELGRHRGRAFRSLDQPPRHENPLIGCARPFDIGHGDAPVHAGLERVEEFGGRDRLDIALALKGLLVRVHRI